MHPVNECFSVALLFCRDSAAQSFGKREVQLPRCCASAASPLARYTRIIQQCAQSARSMGGVALTNGQLVVGLQWRVAIKGLSSNGSHHGQSGAVTVGLLLFLATV